MPVTSHFCAYCEPCDWAGPSRADNLLALDDYDDHVWSPEHRAMTEAIANGEAKHRAEVEALDEAAAEHLNGALNGWATV